MPIFCYPYYPCEPCGLEFDTPSEHEDHLAESPHHHYCKPCRLEFASDGAKQAHLMNSKHHHSDVYCAPCRTLYTQPNNLIMHLRSSIHTPKNVRCPHEACGKVFVSTSALIAHFEASTCRSGVELEDVDHYFAYHCDSQQLFVRKELIYPQRRWQITGHHDGPFECPICHKMFNYAGQIRHHLNSPKHKNHGHKPYVCPSQRCGQAKFYSLSSLLLHRETGDCDMGHRYEFPKILRKLYGIIQQL
ncbi:hypothetical protein PSHT_10450 [Puccinia striiformis]|nr:hypothetical protein PSHT_10450 [Puccinia striiformis]